MTILKKETSDRGNSEKEKLTKNTYEKEHPGKG